MRTNAIHSVTWGLVFIASVTTAAAQTVNPADKAPGEKAGAPADDTRSGDRPHTWIMPPINVFGEGPLREEDKIGDYAQPRWTAHRRFAETRVYVIPKGMVDFEYWMIPETSRDGGTDLANQYELEFGLPGRLQLDLYAVSHKAGSTGTMAFDEQKAELRWALADWGRIWGNPTLYFEWKGLSDAHDHVEAKLLLGGELASRWHWGSNFVWEHEVGGPQENSNEWTVGLSHTVTDARFAVGVETQLALVNSLDDRGARGPFVTEFLVGPSLQLRPLPQMHLDLAPLFGTTPDSPRAKVFVVLGYEF